MAGNGKRGSPPQKKNKHGEGEWRRKLGKLVQRRKMLMIEQDGDEA